MSYKQQLEQFLLFLIKQGYELDQFSEFKFESLLKTRIDRLVLRYCKQIDYENGADPFE